MVDKSLETTAIRNHLFIDKAISCYAVLDGASAPDLVKVLSEHGAEHVCLYRGELESELAAVAPYLVRLPPDAAFTEFVLSGWGRHWGIFVLSGADPRVLRKHFRKFLMVYDPNGKPLYFRYYDPRVLRVYLPTCNAEETETLFGPVLRYVCEGEDSATLLKFWNESGQPKSERIMLKRPADSVS